MVPKNNINVSLIIIVDCDAPTLKLLKVFELHLLFHFSSLTATADADFPNHSTPVANTFSLLVISLETFTSPKAIFEHR